MTVGDGMTFETNAIRINHPRYGLGWFRHVLPEPGHACAEFDGTPEFPAGKRRVLTRDLTPEPLRERAARNDRELADMMGRDPRAVVAWLGVAS